MQNQKTYYLENYPEIEGKKGWTMWEPLGGLFIGIIIGMVLGYFICGIFVGRCGKKWRRLKDI
jgi:cytochrome bd-type quinol oxidase subunit 2